MEVVLRNRYRRQCGCCHIQRAPPPQPTPTRSPACSPFARTRRPLTGRLGGTDDTAMIGRPVPWGAPGRRAAGFSDPRPGPESSPPREAQDGPAAARCTAQCVSEIRGVAERVRSDRRSGCRTRPSARWRHERRRDPSRPAAAARSDHHRGRVCHGLGSAVRFVLRPPEAACRGQRGEDQPEHRREPGPLRGGDL